MDSQSRCAIGIQRVEAGSRPYRKEDPKYEEQEEVELGQKGARAG